MNTEGCLNQFYAKDGEPSFDERLAAATRHCGHCSANGGTAATDAINWKEHVRRYHGGSFDPRVEKCDVYERLRKAEEECSLLSQSDADGDGMKDVYGEEGPGDSEVTEEAE